MRHLKLIAFCFLFVQYFYGSAQEFDITGRVSDQNKEPLSFVNILLLKATDSTMIKGVTSMDDGGFRIEGVAAGTYILKSSYIGYQSDLRGMEVKGNLDVGNIELRPATEALQGITVSFRKPTIEKRPDRLIFSVANTNLSVLSGYDILKRTPGVIVMNNKLLVKNTTPVIYLNNKRVYLSDAELAGLLQGFSGANVDAVEVITNPPASFDAEGSVVLNIVTRNNVSIGYKSAVETKGTYGVFPKYNFNTQHYYKTRDIDFYFNYNFNRSKLFKNDDSYVNFSDVGFGEERWDTDFEKVTRQNDHSINSILDIATGERSTLTLSANVLWSPDKTFNNKARTDVVSSQPGSQYYFNTGSALENDTNNYVFGAEFDTELDEKGTTWSSAANYIYFEQAQFQTLTTEYFETSGSPLFSSSFNSDGRQKNNIFTLQTDLSTTLGEGEFKTGLKYADIASKSNIGFAGTAVPIGAVDDNFEYYEAIYAGYVDFNRSWDQWELQLGARVEYTDVMANSIALGEVNTQEYFGVFPSAGVQYTPSANHSYGLSYGRKITRPRYQSLNPFRYFIIEDQYKEGNPNLTRALEDKITLSYTFKQRYTFELYYQNMDNALMTLPFQQNVQRQLYDSEFNIDYSRQISLDFTAPASISSRWYMYIYSSAYYLEDRFPGVESGNVFVKNSTAGFLGYLYNGITLDAEGELNLEAAYTYMSDYIQGSYRFSNQHYLNLSVRKDLWGQRGSLTLGVDDVFNTMNVPMQSTYLNQDNGFFARPETRKVYVSFRYNFGNFRLQDNNRNTTPAEAERIKLNGGN
ncbi:outer membrane beta-barrel family protein [Robertkochia flava]|uniref:outer membrane beta-barrel family protein n=1 Tax=Robertkochia flava TaxID=3447986 RepID=UPI001CCA8A3B|nr:outer membrane beta-barrel family protein [Robertkochia marina]